MNDQGRQLWETYGSNPQVRKYLDLIAQGEGGAYDIAYGGKKIGLGSHPNLKQRAGDHITTAAGRYQIINETFNRQAKRYGIDDFSPQSQDLAAIAILKEAGALDDIIKGDIGKAIQKTNKIWVSLPGGSQSRLSMQNVQKFYGDPNLTVSAAPQSAEQQAKQAYRQQLLEQYQQELAGINSMEGYQYPSLPQTSAQTLAEAFADLIKPQGQSMDDLTASLFAANAQREADDVRNAGVTSFLTGGMEQAPASLIMPDALKREINRIVSNLQD